MEEKVILESGWRMRFYDHVFPASDSNKKTRSQAGPRRREKETGIRTLLRRFLFLILMLLELLEKADAENKRIKRILKVNTRKKSKWGKRSKNKKTFSSSFWRLHNPSPACSRMHRYIWRRGRGKKKTSRRRRTTDALHPNRTVQQHNWKWRFGSFSDEQLEKFNLKASKQTFHAGISFVH